MSKDEIYVYMTISEPYEQDTHNQKYIIYQVII